MKKILLPIFLFILVNQSFSQDYVSEDPIEEVTPNVVRSDFSVGVSPIIFVSSNEYSGGEPGIGIEFIGLYGLDNNFSVGGFLKTKAEIDNIPTAGPGTGWGGNGAFLKDASWSVGAIFEYKIFNKLGFNIRLGYEEIIESTSSSTSQYNYNPVTGGYSYGNIDNDPGFVYGLGISLYTKKPDHKRVVHSFNWGVTFEGNNFTQFPVLDISKNEFEDTEINAFYVQFGWRIQFHGLKPKN